MSTRLWITAAGAALLITTAAGCSTDTEQHDSEPRNTSFPTDVATAPSTSAKDVATTSAAPSLAAAGVAGIVESLGYDCTYEAEYAMCTLDYENWQIRESPKRDGDRSWVTELCEQGMTSNGTVLTNGSNVVVYAGNEGQNLAMFGERLAAAGAPGLSVVTYC